MSIRNEIKPYKIIDNKNNYEKKGVSFELISLLFLPLSMLFIEWTSHLYMFGFSFPSVIYTMISGLFGGVLAAFIINLFPKKSQFVLCAVYLGIMGVVYSFYMVYYAFFHAVFCFDEIGFAGAITEFWSSTLLAIGKNIYKILTAFVPFAAFLIFGKKRFSLDIRFGVYHLGTAIASVFLAAVFFVSALVPSMPREQLLNIRQDISGAFQTFGVGVAMTDDLLQTVFGFADEDINIDIDDDDDDPTESDIPKEEDPKEKDYEYNTLNVDFDALLQDTSNKKIQEMHKYFASKEPTRQNEYTGMFKGKNLIFLSLEGFSDKVIDPELTPTLYKMQNEGFRFTNFYDSLWGGSTATGEYSNMTGNFYSSAKCLEMSSKTRAYSSLGRLFGNDGYLTYAYHNHNYKYYGRNLSHPNFGYDYKGVGNGVTLRTSQWPGSDLQMAESTASEYIRKSIADKKPFHTYYMTVSGHCNYTFSGNGISSMHKDIVSELEHSSGIKAYIACQYELELMLENLIEQLDSAGILDDTVFAMCTDHYPYALSDAELSELYGLPAAGIRSNFELYKNGFLLWSSCMEKPIVVDTPCSSYDMVPTLANLFGIPYESRVITGTDIFSDTQNIVILNTLDSIGNWNWITEYGTYVYKTKKFTPTEKCPYSGQKLDDYVSKCSKRVNLMRAYSPAILDYDYYKYVFDSDFKPLRVTQ